MNKMNMMKYLGSESSWLSGCAGATPVARTLECGTTRAAVPKVQFVGRNDPSELGENSLLNVLNHNRIKGKEVSWTCRR